MCFRPNYIDVSSGFLASCRSYDLDTIESQLRSGIHPNTTTNNGLTGLHITAFHGYTELANLLLDYQAEVNCETRDGLTPLDIASQHGHVEFVLQLLQRGAFIDHENLEGMRAEHYACCHDYIKVLKVLIRYKADINDITLDGSTRLILAAKFGSLRCVEYLLDNDVNMNHTRDDKCGVVHVAASEKHNNILKELIRRGSDVNIQNQQGHTALFISCSLGDIRSVEYLLRANADITLANKDGWQPIHITSYIGNIELLEMLITHNPDINSQTKTLHTPLYLASQEGHANCVSLLLSRGASVNLAGQDGMTPLHVASSFLRTDIIPILVDHGADIDVQTKAGHTPLLHSIEAVNSGASKIHLADIGAVKNVVTSKITKEGTLPATVEDKSKNEAFNYLSQKIIILLPTKEGNPILNVTTLLELGADPSIPAYSGWSPLHAASKSGQASIVDNLLTAVFFRRPIKAKLKYKKLYPAIDVNSSTATMTTALMLASSIGSLDCLDLLLKCKNIDLELADVNGMRAIHFACENNQDKVVVKLLHHGANIEVYDKRNWLPIHLTTSKQCAKLCRSKKEEVSIIEVNFFSELLKTITANGIEYVTKTKSGIIAGTK